MGLLSSLGVDNIGGFGGINWAGMGMWALGILGAFAVLIVVGVITFAYYSSKLKKSAFGNLVVIYQEVNGKIYRIGTDNAKEVYVPDTNISLFFLKGRKLYIAKPTRAMGKNEFWYKILPNGEWVNFDMSSHPEDNMLAVANYDHRDTRYAYTNIKEIIKRNYTSKSVPWWKDPVIMNIIAFVIMAFVFILGCWFLITRMSSWLHEMVTISQNFLDASKNMMEAVKTSQNLNSGIIQG